MSDIASALRPKIITCESRGGSTIAELQLAALVVCVKESAKVAFDFNARRFLVTREAAAACLALLDDCELGAPCESDKPDVQ